MKKIINTYKKTLTFPQLDFSIGSNEIKEVNNIIFNKIIENQNIHEYKKNLNNDEKVEKNLKK